MKTFKVTVGVTLNAFEWYEEVEIEAESQAGAELKVGGSIKEKSFDSALITGLVSEAEWNSLENLRVIPLVLIDLPEGGEPVNHKKFSVTVGVTLNAYEEVEIEAESQGDAERKADKIVEEKGFNASLVNMLVFEPDWNSMEDLRVLMTDYQPGATSDDPMNYLEGMVCPGCGSGEAFKIEVRTMVTMFDSGSTDAGDEKWDEKSFCECIACGRSGKVRQFRKGASKKGKE